MDNASFVASLTPELRQEILQEADDNFIASLPESLRAEAQVSPSPWALARHLEMRFH
jgi:hypothetical protein